MIHKTNGVAVPNLQTSEIETSGMTSPDLGPAGMAIPNIETLGIHGPHGRVSDTETLTHKQVSGIMAEIVTANDKLRALGPAVSIFGSARINEPSPYYKKCVAVSAALAQAGFTIIAGGGPGLMEAANKGAYQKGGTSVGLNMVLPHEESNNAYQTISLMFEYFYTRKATFFKHSFAYIALPGGFGTLDELFEALTLVQTGKIPAAPIILVGTEYWQGVVDWLATTVERHGAINKRDLALLTLEDNPDTIVQLIYDFFLTHYLSSERYSSSLPV